MTAITLPQYLYDGAGYLWDIYGDGGIGDGTNDAYDGGPPLCTVTSTPAAPLTGFISPARSTFPGIRAGRASWRS